MAFVPKMISVRDVTYDKLKFLKECYDTSFDSVIDNMLKRVYGAFTDERKKMIKEKILEMRAKALMDKI